MKNKILKIVALIMVIGLFSSCSKDYFEGPLFYPDDFGVDIVDAYPAGPNSIKIDFAVSNLSNLDYYQGQDGNYYLEFSIASNNGSLFYNEIPIGTLYAGEYFRGSMIIQIDPRMTFNLNNITYDIYDADRY